MGSTCRFCGATADTQGFCDTCQRPLDLDPESLLSQTIGSHRIERLVGEGPIGVVYEATHLPSGDRCRLKRVDSELLETDPSLVESAGGLVVDSMGLHESLPQLVEVSLEKGDHRLVSVKWVEGRTLRELLDEGPVNESEACVIVGGALKALDALHGSGQAHCDLKPENVLIAPPGVKPHVHLLDVGSSLISAKARIGVQYRSPEQARGGSKIGAVTDIYSAGALLYELFGGKPPYEASSYDVLISRISLRPPAPLLELRPDLDPTLLEVVERAMAQASGDRYRSASDMLRALRNYIAAQQRPSTPEARSARPGASGAPPTPPPTPPPPSASSPPATPTSSRGKLLDAPDLPPPPPRPVSAPVADEPFHFEVEDFSPPKPKPEPKPEPEPVEARKGGGKKIAAVVFVLMALVIGGGLIYFAIKSNQEMEAIQARLEAQAQPDAGQTKTPRRERRGTVRVKLTGLPEEARWFVDGRRLGANPFRAPRNPGVHKVRVEAPDHETFETEVSFSENLEIAVEMSPIEAEGRRPAGFKAYTYGRGANQRPRRRGSKQGQKAPENPFSATKAPADLRQR